MAIALVHGCAGTHHLSVSWLLGAEMVLQSNHSSL